MGYNRVNERQEIAGFWTREADTKLEGQVKRFMPTDTGGYYIIETICAGTPLQGPDEDTEGRDNQAGEIVAVSGSAALECLKDLINKGCVRITSHGQIQGKGNKTFWSLDVDHDPNARPARKPAGSQGPKSPPSGGAGPGEDVPF